MNRLIFWFYFYLFVGNTVLAKGQGKFYTCQEIFPQVLCSWLFAHPETVVIDVRPKTEFDSLHIVNAISAFTDSLLITYTDSLDKEQKIIFYDDKDEESIDACLLFASRGYKEVYHLKGGMDEWIRLKYSVETPFRQGIENKKDKLSKRFQKK